MQERSNKSGEVEWCKEQTRIQKVNKRVWECETTRSWDCKEERMLLNTIYII